MSVLIVKRRIAFLICGSGIGLIIFGIIIGWIIVPMIVKSKVEEIVAIRSGTEAYERWETLPVTMLFKVYLFEVVNSERITKYGEKPIVQERGPFVYREKRKKIDIKMFEEEDRAVYMQKSEFEFADDLSPLSDETKLTLVNVPAIGFAQIAESLPGLRDALHIFNQVINKMWPEGPVFIKVKVKDILFNKINMLCHYEKGETSIEKLMWKAMCLAYAYIRPRRTVNIDDGEPGLNTFSYFKYKENSLDGPYEVKLGIKEPERIGEILKWKEKEDLNGIWGGKSCDRLLGSDGTIFKPFLDGVDTLSVFNSDICRSVNLSFVEKSEFKGVPTRRYIVAKDTLTSVLHEPNNYCFCPRSVLGLTTIGGCLKSGLLDLSSCQGAPIYMSNPHYFMADPFYQEMVEGLHPHGNEHQIFVELEPHTGYPMKGAIRAQLNAFLKKIPQIDCMKNYNNTIIPLLWLDEGVELSEELVDEVKSRLLNILFFADIGVWVVIAIGAILTLVSIIFFVYRMIKK